MILKNLRAKDGYDTEGVVIPYSVFNRFCNIEKEFHTKETYTIVQSGEIRKRQLNRITNSDIQCFTIMHKVCTPSKGSITNVKKHSIFRKLEAYFEKPIVASEFYASLEKLLYHGIIREEYDQDTDLHSFYIIDYYEEKTGKPNFFAVVSPVVFTADFYQLGIGQKKLFYSLSIQQGGITRPLHRSIDGIGKEDVQYRLKDFLHRKDTYLIKQLADGLTTSTYQDIPFLEQASFSKKGKKYVQATFKIHPNWTMKVEKKEYHDLISPVVVYPKKTHFIERILHQLGLGEIASQNNQLELIRLVRYFRNKGYRVIRYALGKLKEFVESENSFPRYILSFVKSVCRSDIEAQILDLARQTHVIPWVAAGAIDPIDREDREFSFLSTMSHYKLSELKQAFNQVLSTLRSRFASIDQDKSLLDYRTIPALDNVPGIEVVRRSAYRANSNQNAYRELEGTYQSQLVYSLVTGEDTAAILNQMLADIDKLDINTYKVHVPSHFRLESFIISNGFVHPTTA